MPSRAVYRSDMQAPPRWLLRPAGVLTQLASAFALLVGTIGFVLVQVNATGGTPLAVAWAAAAMAGLILGGLMARGGIPAVIGGAIAMFGMGGVLVIVDHETLGVLLSLLQKQDVSMIQGILFGFGIAMLGIGVLCVASIPQARRYNRELRAAEDEAEKSGIWEMPFPVPSTIPAPGAPPPAAQLPPYLLPATPGAGSASSGALATQPERPGAQRDVPLPAPPPSVDGVHARAGNTLPPGMTEPWGEQAGPPSLRESPAAGATAPGWQPAPVKTYRTTMMIVRPPAEERRSRRRVYIALGGLAIGLGAGVGVLVSSAQRPKAVATAPVSLDAAAPALPSALSNATTTPPAATPDAANVAGSAAESSAAVVDASVAELDASTDALTREEMMAGPPSGALEEPDKLITLQHQLIASVDAKGYAATFAPNGFFIGLDANDLAEGRAAIAEVVARNLAFAQDGKLAVTSRYFQLGRDLNHVWIAEELELATEGQPSRRFNTTQLASYVDGVWFTVVAHWSRPVPDATAEKLAILGTLPTPKAFAAKASDAQLRDEVAAMFSSRIAFARARNLRDDAFNFGSAPGERMVGGEAIQRVFSRLKSTMRATGPIRAVHAGEWDPSQVDRQRVAYAALNVAYTQKSRAATDYTQTFRVLAILLYKNEEWQIIQTHFSNAGPIGS